MDFNPIKETIDGKKAHDMIWTTKVLETAIRGLEKGKKLIANPFYENNTKLLKSDLVFRRTKEEIAEWVKCKNDIIYFSNTYCKLMTPQGVKNVTMRDYQEDYLRHLANNRLSIFLSCRQSGKTTTSAIFMLHYILFNTDKNSLVLGNKRKTAVEILTKLKSVFLELPYFLKPGVYKWNESEIVLDNGCRCMAESTTINSGISFTFHCVLWDEAAHVPPNIIDKFYNNLFPTITAGKARFIISSTQNGYNLFYRLWCAAVAKENEYAPFKVDWWQVPEWNPEKQCWEERTEEWRRIQVANYGGEENFNRQFGTNFDISGNTLINSDYLKKRQNDCVGFVTKDLPGVTGSEYFFWHPDYEPVESAHEDFFAITIDIAEGINGDYTTYIFNKLAPGDKEDEVKFVTVGFFHCNDKDVKWCAHTLREFCLLHMTMDRYKISIERNLYGELFANYLMDEIENDMANLNRFNEDCFVKYWDDHKNMYIIGTRINHQNKVKGCKLFKYDFENGMITNKSDMFVNELTNFCDTKGTNVYKATFGHDDLVMAQMQVEFVKDSLSFKNLKDDFSMYCKTGNTGGATYNPWEALWGNAAMPVPSGGGWFDMPETSSSDTLSRLNKFNAR